MLRMAIWSTMYYLLSYSLKQIFLGCEKRAGSPLPSATPSSPALPAIIETVTLNSDLRDLLILFSLFLVVWQAPQIATHVNKSIKKSYCHNTMIPIIIKIQVNEFDSTRKTYELKNAVGELTAKLLIALLYFRRTRLAGQI